MSKKITALLLALLLLFPLAACGNSGTDSGKVNETTASAPMTEDITESETTRDFPEYQLDGGGKDLNILYFDPVAFCGWSDQIACDVNTDEETGDLLGDAVYLRNRKVEELLNITIKAQDYTDRATSNKKIGAQVMAGSADYDICIPQWGELKSLIPAGYLTPLDGCLDFSKPWYDQKSEATFKITGKTWGAISDMNYMVKLLSIIIMFNKQIAADYNMGNFYAEVIDKKWTFDRVKELGMLVSADLDGNDIYDKNDSYGFSGQDDAMYELYQSAGLMFCKPNAEGIPEFAMKSELAVTVLQDVAAFMNDKAQFFNRQTHGLNIIETENMFIQNQVLFLMRPMQSLLELRAMEADFGVIPTPLMTEEQENYSTSIGYTVSPVCCIPAVVSDLELSAAAIDLLSAESYYSLNEIFYEVLLNTKILRDDESKICLDMIYENRLYDPGCAYDFGGICTNIMAQSKRGPDTIASFLDKNESKVQKDIEKFIEGMKSLEG